MNTSNVSVVRPIPAPRLSNPTVDWTLDNEVNYAWRFWVGFKGEKPGNCIPHAKVGTCTSREFVDWNGWGTYVSVVGHSMERYNLSLKEKVPQAKGIIRPITPKVVG